jgi:acyl-CoA thioesterase-2
MSTPLDDVLDILDLERLEANLFRGRSPREDRQRAFGGQVAAQALVAAVRTVDAEDSDVHSLHAYFLRPGDVRVPIIYEVDRTRDGRSFSTRRVVAIQHGKAIFTLSASFHRREQGYEHQAPMPDVPDPERLPTWNESMAPLLNDAPEGLRKWILRERPFDMRYVGEPDWIDRRALEPSRMIWIRADGELVDDPMVHEVLVSYASDMMLLDTALRPHAVSVADHGGMLASLDHAMWFHREFRADQWLLYAMESPSSSGARGFATGRFFTRDGRLAASVAQEGLIRPPRGKEAK